MMKIMLMKIVFLFFIFFMAGCANFFIRQECKNYNWYQLGYEAALRGDRISNDPKISRCRSAEAEISESQLDVGFKAGMSRYCQPETAFQTGKQGDTLNSDFCESNILGLLKRKHSEGNLAYCSDGLTAGQSGKKYKNVCSAELEKKFTPEYKKGRQKYLTNLVQLAESKKRDASFEMNQINADKLVVDQRLSRIPYIKAGEHDPYLADRNQLTQQASSLGSQLNQLRYKLTVLDKEITEYQTELATLI